MKVGELLAVGRTADVHAFGTDAVVKVPGPETPGHWAQIEADISTAVHRHGLPTPAVRDVMTIDGRECIVFDRIQGPTMWQRMLEQPTEVEALATEMVGLQRMIHAAGIPEGVPDLTSRLQSKTSACSAITEGERDEAAHLVAGLPRGAALLHGDLHPGNVLLGPDGPVVIDWFDAAIGHPVADVIRSSFLLRLGFEGGTQQSLPDATRSLLDQTHAAYVHTWRTSIELETNALKQWEPVLALARISEGHEETAPLLELWNRREMASA